MKTILRRLLSVLLTLAIIGSGFFIFDPTALFPTAKAQVAVTAAGSTEPVRLVVPEAIYLKPTWDCQYTTGTYAFQWYVNNAMGSNGNISCETGEDPVGDIYFYYPDAVNASLRFEWLNAAGVQIDGGRISFDSGTTVPIGQSYSIESSISPVHVVGGTSCSMTAAQSGAYLRWIVSFTDRTDGRVKTVKAYTYVYKPYIEPVGVALRSYNNRGTDSYGQNISWISGVHDTADGYMGSHYPNTCRSADGKGLLAFSNSANNGVLAGALYAQFGSTVSDESRFFFTDISNKASNEWLNQTTSPLYVPDRSMNYVSNGTNGSNTGDNAFYTFGYSPRAVLYVDSSRYSNLDQIPNLSVGLMVTDDEGTKGSGAWFVSNYTGAAATGTQASYEKNSTSASEALWNKYKTASAENLLASVGSYTSSTWVGGAETEGIKYNGRWKKEIGANTASGMFYIGTGYFNHDSTDSDHCGGDTNWNVSELRAQITFCNKLVLRSAVRDAISYAAVLNEAFYQINSAYWTNYQNLFHAASMALTKLDGAFSASAMVDGQTRSYSTPAALADALNNAVQTLLSGSGRVNASAAQTNIAMHKQADGTYKTAKFNTSSKAFVSRDRVTFTGDGFIGYHFLGLQKTQHTPVLTVGTAVSCPTEAGFTTSATGAVIQGETVDYAHSDVTGTDGSGNLYYSYYYLANNYTVQFNANGGSGEMADQAMTYDQSAALKANAFTRIGYSFTGWAATPNSAAIYGNGETVTNLTSADGGTVTLYACWKADTYTITYVLNGGTISDTLYSKTYSINAGPTLPHAAKPGYVFEGWKANNAGNWSTLTYSPMVMTAGKHGDVTLTACWTTISYTVAFNANGGSGSMSNQTFTYDEEKPLTANAFSKNGYRFNGWATVADASQPLYGDRATVSKLTTTANATVTLYALWSPVTYSIVYNTADGTIADSGYNESYTVENAVRLPQNVTKTGYVFGGWALMTAAGNWSGTQIYSGTLNVGMYGSVTLRAVWQTADYSVSYNTNGGTISGTNYSTAYTIEAAVTLPRAAKTGYTFSGWKANGAGNWGTAVYNAGRVAVGQYGNVILTAQWTGVSYAVCFNGNHSTGGMMYNQTMTYGTDSTLTANVFVRTGYTFRGWSLSDAATEPTYGNGAVVRNLAQTAGAVVTLYAVWSKDTYTITYENGGGTTLTDVYTTVYTVTDAVTLPDMAKTGYTFGGWKANGAGNWGTDSFRGNLAAGKYGNVTLTAQWTLSEYPITFDANGGTISGTAPAKYNISGDIHLPTVTRDGYTFDGWKASWNGLLYFTTVPAGLYGDITFTAQWTQKKYYVQFCPNGAESGTMENQTFGFSTEQALSANAFVRPGYTFSGWSLTSTGAVMFADGALVRNLTDVSGQTVLLYAIWTARSFSVRYDLNGAAGSMLASSVTMDGAEITLRNCTLTQATIGGSAYTFGGWAISAENAANGITSYENKAAFALDGNMLEVLDINWSASKPVITLYAVWIPANVELHVREGSTAVIDRDRGFIYGLEFGVTQDALDNIFLRVDGNGHLEYETNGFIGTGTVVRLINDNTNEVEETYEIVIYGDLNGDGIAGPTDLTILQSVLVGSEELSETSAQFCAADVSGDRQINTSDLTVIKALVAGSTDLNQATCEMIDA